VLKRALENATAFALDMLAQIERANVSSTINELSKLAITERLLKDVIHKAINLIPSMLISHSIRRPPDINRKFEGVYPPPVVGDPGALTNVFKNILENSIKYSQKDQSAKIRIAIEIKPDWVCVDVRDYGIGLQLGEEELVFTQGFRSAAARNHRVRGSGQGLAYCRRIVENFGGKIMAQRNDDGLTIRVELKRKK